MLLVKLHTIKLKLNPSLEIVTRMENQLKTDQMLPGCVVQLKRSFNISFNDEEGGRFLTCFPFIYTGYLIKTQDIKSPA